MGFNVKEDIMKAINGTDDPAMRTVFMLMLGLFESFNEKLDKVLGDEKAMREAVLNGHEPVHHSHHEWIERRIKRDPEIEAIVTWCIAAKKREETNEQSGRKIRDGLIEKVIWSALAGAVMFVLGRGGV
jgi:hypothetical protein